MNLRAIAALTLALVRLGSVQAVAEEAIVVALEGPNHVTVTTAQFPLDDKLASQQGLVIWNNNGRDAWARLSATVESGSAERAPSSDATGLAGTRGEGTGDQQVIAMTTRQIDQLVGAELVRDARPGDFITPPDKGVLLNPAITIRRLPFAKAPEFPADELLLFKGKEQLLKIPMVAGDAVLRWSDVPGLIPALRDGLAPGNYQLRSSKSNAQAVFRVLPSKVRRQIELRSVELGELLGNRHDLLAVQLLAEDLLGQTDQDGQPLPLLADALDLLDSIEKPTPYLESLRKGVADALAGKQELPEQLADSTGSKEIDQARQHITRGEWQAAIALLAGAPADVPPRIRGLTLLYEAVVLAESGAALGGDAERMFRAALEQLQGASPADVYRAHNNFANFLLRRSQDRLYNHAFQSASGSQHPLFSALQDWREALTHFDAAAKLGETVSPDAAAAVAANMGRHYLLLADILNVLNSTLKDEERFALGEQSAFERAETIAAELVKTAQPNSHLLRAVAHEIQAQSAHRRSNGQACREHAEQALQHYLSQGSLVGAEGIYRLLGLSHARQAASETKDAQSSRDAALRHLLVSHSVAEALRERFPADEIGLTRAGFFARRAYVNEKIIELYLQDGKADKALQFLEAAKSRALEDVLLLNKKASPSQAPAADHSAELLSNWPQDVVALEYFLGTQRSWVFLIQGQDRIRAFPLTDSQSNPVDSRQLVADLQRFLFDIEGSSQKLLRTVVSGGALDASWQDKLHAFYNVLLPPDVRREIESSKNILIVPHHILHYFPFAALVVEPEVRSRKPFEMAMPKFWIEQGQNLFYAPSLSIWALLRTSSNERFEQVNAVAISKFASAKPLKGVKDDLANLRAAFGDMVSSVLEDDDATEAQLRASLEKKGFTFIGTHGVNIADQPLESYLLCQAGEDEDGRLMAGEIYGTKLAANVVVLSACYSGLGDRSPLPGDDLFGLQRALLQAGASTIVTGLWDVYEDTGVAIMRDFFMNVRAGQPTPQALANAQRKFLAERRKEGPQDFWIHPYFWAVYKSTGSDVTRMAGK